VSAPQDYTIKVAFEMADPEGTAAVRVVAGHAARVAQAWQATADEMSHLADALDRLVERSSATPEVGES
jgi:hypothetical protein